METQTFFGWWQMIVCLFAATALLSIWWHLGRKQEDRGQVWLAMSVICWSISGGIEILEAERIFTDVTINNGLRSILSLLNSFFILLSLPWFRHIPKSIAFLVKSPSWFYLILFPFLICLFATLGMMFNQENFSGFISSLDVLYALVPTLPFLGWILWESFAKRQLRLLSWLSLTCILFIVIAQILKLSPSNQFLFSGIFKTTLIMLFFALAMSWVKELVENPMPIASKLHLGFSIQRNEGGSIERKVLLNGYPNTMNNQLALSRAPFELLLRFAQRKVEDKEAWLIIKAKNDKRNNTNFDISDHNQVKRIITALLDQLHGRGNWTTEQHYTPFRNALFELSSEKERRIRLAIPQEQIDLSEMTLSDNLLYN
ncbi:MAG: hypothetical protein AAFP82_01425 [Bacteroidota bacterium]